MWLLLIRRIAVCPFVMNLTPPSKTLPRQTKSWNVVNFFSKTLVLNSCGWLPWLAGWLFLEQVSSMTPKSGPDFLHHRSEPERPAGTGADTDVVYGPLFLLQRRGAIVVVVVVVVVVLVLVLVRAVTRLSGHLLLLLLLLLLLVL